MRNSLLNILRGPAMRKDDSRQAQGAKRNTRGFTLIELLCASAITVLIAGMLVTLTGLMGNTVENIVAHSNARVLCSTLTTAAQDELRYASNIEVDANTGAVWFRSGAIGFGDRCRLAAVDDNDKYTARPGYLALYTGNADTVTVGASDGKNYQRKLVEKATYTNGLTASIDVEWESSSNRLKATVSVYDNTGALKDSRTFYTIKNARDIKAGAA